MTLQKNELAESIQQIHSRADERMDQVIRAVDAQATRLYNSQEVQLGPSYGAEAQMHARRSRAVKLEPKSHPTRSDAFAIRLHRYSANCRPSCPCTCHVSRKSVTPSIVDRVLGRLLVSYSGIPAVRAGCNTSSCKQSRTPRLDLEYWFPLGLFWSQIIRLQCSYESHLGPQFQLSTLRRVADNSQCVDLALAGDIEGLKDLFKRSAASPRDVSSTRGYSLLRVKKFRAQTFCLLQR